jgi:hypothetical protein
VPVRGAGRRLRQQITVLANVLLRCCLPGHPVRLCHGIHNAMLKPVPPHVKRLRSRLGVAQAGAHPPRSGSPAVPGPVPGPGTGMVHAARARPGNSARTTIVCASRSGTHPARTSRQPPRQPRRCFPRLIAKSAHAAIIPGANDNDTLGRADHTSSPWPPSGHIADTWWRRRACPMRCMAVSGLRRAAWAGKSWGSTLTLDA